MLDGDAGRDAEEAPKLEEKYQCIRNLVQNSDNPDWDDEEARY